MGSSYPEICFLDTLAFPETIPVLKLSYSKLKTIIIFP